MVEHSAQRHRCRSRRHAPLGPPRPRQEGARNFKDTGKFVILSENKILAHMRGLGDKKLFENTSLFCFRN